MPARDVGLRTGLMDLIANTYAHGVLDAAMRAREFELLGRLAERVILRRVRAHQDAARLPALCAALLDDLAALPLPRRFGRPR